MATRGSSGTKGAITNRPAGRAGNPSDGSSSAVRDLVVHATRLQLAALTSISTLVAGWAQSADRYAQAVSDEFMSRVHGDTPPRELVTRLAVVSNTHLHEVSALPAEAVSHFTSELTNTAQPRARRRTHTHRRTGT
jgi:hypothetical protein